MLKEAVDNYFFSWVTFCLLSHINVKPNSIIHKFFKMSSIIKVLSQNHSNKTKTELTEMMKNLQSIIGRENYNQISGVDPKDLMSNTKNEILDVMEDFKSEYNSDWEAVSKKSKDAFVSFVKGVKAVISEDETQFRLQNASDAGFAAELGSIDFENLIAGPLNACVTAQNKASMATVDFIKNVGFKDGDSGEKELVMVKFKCEKPQINPYLGKTAGEGGVPAGADTISEYLSPNKKINVEVPLISIINIPSLRIETCEVDFNVKLNSVYTKDVTNELGIDANVSGGWGPVKFKVSASYKRTSSTGVRVEKEYSMGVKVKATNDQLPAGLEQVLGILAE